MIHQKTWLTSYFNEGKASIELTINYENKTFSMSHGSNDNNVTFNGNVDNLKVHFDRLKCVRAALLFVKQELK